MALQERKDGAALRLAFALGLTAIHLAIGLGVLACGHPHEDAYILFKYARELARGSGIVYFPGGPHAEGATDFLWMVLLAGARVLGIDVAVAAALVSSVAFFLCVRLFAFDLPSPFRVRDHWPHVLFVVLLLAAPCAVAGYVGFSAVPFSVLALYMYRHHVAGTDRALLPTPPLALLLGLIRPDGVILGAGFVVLALGRISKGARGRYLMSCVLVALAGGAYFAWRWHYFGSLLPLPLYVKSHYHGVPPGLDATLDWLLASVVPLVVLALAAHVLADPTRRQETPGKSSLPPPSLPWPSSASWRLSLSRPRLVGLLPFVVHAASFALGTPSQNIAHRFQAPATLALLYLAFLVGTERGRERGAFVRRIAYAAAIGVVFFPHATMATKVVLDSFERHYMNVFGAHLAALADGETRIATTEAGRMAYWTNAKVVDLVGLNTPETARVPPTAAFLSDFDPDIVMLHHASTIDEACLSRAAEAVMMPMASPLGTCLRPWSRFLYRTDNPPYDALHIENIFAAPVAAAAFLDARPEAYELWAVPFKSRDNRFHLYAIKRTYPRKAAVLEALRESEASGRVSYLALLAGAQPR